MEHSTNPHWHEEKVQNSMQKETRAQDGPRSCEVAILPGVPKINVEECQQHAEISLATGMSKPLSLVLGLARIKLHSLTICKV